MIVDDFDFSKSPIDRRYNFPNTEGVAAQRIIELWVVRYLALLFIRHYTFPVYYAKQASIFPNLPKTNVELGKWLNYLNFFKTQVEWVHSNIELLEITRLKNVTDERVKQNKLVTPTDYFIQLRRMLESKLQQS